jgi:hypothetical protein
VNIKSRKGRAANAHVSRREKDLFDNFSDMTYIEEKFHEYVSRYKYVKADRFLILKALDFARLAHDGQKREEGVPYITHPIRVANVLLHELSQMESDMVCTALLHDVIEDCSITTKELKNNFNDPIAHMVKILSKDPRIENHRQVYYEGILHSNDEIKLIKVCDPGYLVKPFSPNELLIHVDCALAQARRRRREQGISDESLAAANQRAGEMISRPVATYVVSAATRHCSCLTVPLAKLPIPMILPTKPNAHDVLGASGGPRGRTVRSRERLYLLAPGPG